MKKKLNFSSMDFANPTFDVKEVSEESKEAIVENKIENKFDSDNFKTASNKKSLKKYIYKEAFNSVLDKDGPKATANLYYKNKERLKILRSLNPKVTEMDILNYIFEDFFKRNAEEIVEEHNNAQKNLKNNLL